MIHPLPDHYSASPINIEAERATLGAVLLNREAIVAIAPWLAPDDFGLPAHAAIYAAMLACYHARVPPDLRTVTEELRRRRCLAEIGGVAGLAALSDATPTSAHVVYYAQIVQRAALLRRLTAVGGQIAALGFQEQADVDELLDQAEALLGSVTRHQGRADFIALSQVVEDYYARLLLMQEQPDLVVGLPTGLEALDDLLGGLHAGDLIVLAARPGVGKTATMLTMAYHLARAAQATVGIVSLEMSREQLLHRLLAIETGIDTTRLRSGQVREAELQRLFVAMGNLATLPIFIDDSAGQSLLDLRSKARRLHSQAGMEVLMVDYVQLLRGRRSEHRVQEVGEVARGLKDLARELGVPVVALAQLNRAVEGRAGHVPLLSDLRESGELEQAADVVGLLAREELYDPDTHRRGLIDLHIAKHRHGPVGVLPLRFDAPTTRLQDAPEARR